jgi:hypothetical protein
MDEAHMASERVKRLLDRYRTLGAEPEIELAQALYRCLKLDARLKRSDGRSQTAA